MKAEWKARWIEALRSPDNKQCFHAMRKEDNYFCPMGLLIKIIHENTLEEQETPIITDLEPWNMFNIMCMSDVDHKSFNEIADWIEINL